MPAHSYVLKLTEAGNNEDNSIWYRHTYQVKSTALNDSPLDISGAVPLLYWSPHPSNLGALLKTKQVTQTDDLTIWSLVVTWDTKASSVDKGTVQPAQPGATPESPGTNNNQQPPAQRPWVLKWGSTQAERPLERDYNISNFLPGTIPGEPVVNSAGVPFDPPVMVRQCNPTLQITAWRLQAQEAKILAFTNKVNKHSFGGAPPGYALCTQYAVTSQYENGIWMWQVDITIEFKEDGWNPVRVLDAGTLQKVGSQQTGFRLKACLDSLGQAVTSPVPLDGFGAQLAAGGTINYLDFVGYQEADFNQLI